MAEAIRIWEVGADDSLAEIERAKLNLEGRLEAWVEVDVSVLSDNLLVIGRQVETEVGGYIDLLCLSRSGDLVIVELKRNRTPREVTAQVLDYGAWAYRLSNEQINRIAERHLGQEEALAEAYRERFGEELPEVLNENHRMLVVATEVDPRTERLIQYLSDAYGVNINAVTFNYFRTADGRELLARTHLLEPERVEQRTKERSGSKRRHNLTAEEMREVAEEQGVGLLYDRLLEALSSSKLLGTPAYTRTTASFYASEGEGWVVVFNIVPNESGAEEGLCYRIYIHRFARNLGISESEILRALPEGYEPWQYTSGRDYEGFTGYFKSVDDVERFAALVGRAQQREGE